MITVSRKDPELRASSRSQSLLLRKIASILFARLAATVGTTGSYANLLLLLCLSWAMPAAAQICGAEISISPSSSPIPSGTPVSITVNWGGPVVDTITGNVSLNGTQICVNSGGCNYTDSNPASGTNTITWSCTASGIGGNGSNSGSTTFTVAAPAGTQGLAYPKYVVVGVTYAPPGASSDVQYTGTTSIGTTSTYSSSFTQGYSIGVTTSWGIDIPSGTPTPPGGVTLTIGETNTLTQGQNTSTTNTTNKSTSVSYQTAGYPTTNSPNGTPAPALPDDYDVIWVWLNPELVFTAYPASGSNPASIQWNGYAYDPYDQDYPDVEGFQVGCLNGDFTASYCASQQGGDSTQGFPSGLNRAWVLNEPIQQMSPTTSQLVTAAGCSPQTSESPSICPNTQDAYNILATDPLAYNPGGTAYTWFDSDPLPLTTPDGRYTMITGNNDPNPVQYLPGETETYNLTQMNTQSQSNGGSQKTEEKITISAKVNSSFLNIFNETTTYTNTDDFTQENTWLNTLSTTQTVADAFKIQASNPPNYLDGVAAPGEFTAYQDNLYGTWVIVPSPFLPQGYWPVVNSDFATTPPMTPGNGTYVYNPTNVLGWTFNGGSGVAEYGSAWGFDAAPDAANQVAFLQNTSTLTQTATGLTAGQQYTLSFYLEDRPGFASNPVTVSIGGTTLASITPAGGWTQYTETFTAAASSEVLSFSTSESGGDNDAGLSDVTVVIN
jgi:Protein of unknown function (DUF642)